MANLHVRDAVDIAKREITSLFESEDISNVGLEEVVHDPDSGRWRITIGFKRPWEEDGPLTNPLFRSQPARTYKLVSVDDRSAQVLGVTDRALPYPME